MGEDLAALKRGDTREFARFVHGHERQVFAHLSRVLGSVEDAQDLAQEVFLRAWKGLPAFRGDSALSTWLYRITHHVAMSALEKRSRMIATVPEREAEHAAAPDPDPTDATDVRRLIAKLSPPQRAALTLFYLQDLPVSEVAEVMGVPVNTVKTHLSRGRQALAALIEETGAKL